MKLRYRIFFFLLGIVGMGIMIWQTEIKEEQWNILLSANTILFLLGMIGLWIIIYIIHVVCYFVILGNDWKKVPILSMFKICFSGFALNSVTPAGLVGGEPYRIMALKKYCSTEKASSSTLTFSLFYVIGHISIWLAGTILYFAFGLPGETVYDIIFIITSVVTTLIIVAFFLSKRRGLVRPFMAFLTKIPLLKKPMKKVYDKNLDSYLEIDNNIRAFRATRLRFWTVFVLQFLTRFLECVEYYLIFVYLGQKINIFGGVMLLVTASLIGNLVFFIPMQAGSRDVAVLLAGSFLAISSGVCSTGAIIYRVRDLLCIVIGVALIMFDKRKKNIKLNDIVEGKPIPEDATEDSQITPETADNTGAKEDVNLPKQ